MEVHPPEHPIHTWRDFFVHIATIVVGLLIALGLEQMVVLIEHHHEIKETEERLKVEREANIRLFHKNVSFMRDTIAELRGDTRVLEYLKAHPSASQDQLPGVLNWTINISGIQTTVWDWTEKAPVLELLPQDEVQNNRSLYEILKDSETRHIAMWDCITEAGDYRFMQPDVSKLTPQQIQIALDRVQVCLRKTFQYAVSLNNIGLHDPDFAPGPSNAELNSLAPEPTFNANAAALELSEKDRAAAQQWGTYDKAMMEFMQTLAHDNFNNAAGVYDTIASKYPGFKPDEQAINDLGYDQMNGGNISQSLGIFHLNVRLNPASWNAYDSLGEAYRKAGDKQQAISNYEKSIQLNPQSKSGIKALSELRK